MAKKTTKTTVRGQIQHSTIKTIVENISKVKLDNTNVLAFLDINSMYTQIYLKEVTSDSDILNTKKCINIQKF